MWQFQHLGEISRLWRRQNSDGSQAGTALPAVGAGHAVLGDLQRRELAACRWAQVERASGHREAGKLILILKTALPPALPAAEVTPGDSLPPSLWDQHAGHRGRGRGGNRVSLGRKGDKIIPGMTCPISLTSANSLCSLLTTVSLVAGHAYV